MARPSKLELLARFFPELRQSAGSRGERQQSLAYNTLACEVVLADLLRLYDQGLRQRGPGVLCVRLAGGSDASSYLTLEDLQADRSAAAAAGDQPTETLLADVLRQVDALDPETVGLVLLVDRSSAQLFPVPRDQPARNLQGLLEEFSA
jgi:hypothetical protein